MAACSVLTFNVLGNPGKPRQPVRMPLIARALANLAPDVILLQELDWPDEQATGFAASIARPGNSSYRPYVSPLVATNGWKEALAIITCLPVREHQTLSLPDGEVFCHRLLFDMGRQLLAVSNCHLDPYNPARRALQIQLIATWMSEFDMAVVGGDFNVPPDDPALEPIERVFASAHVTANGTEPMFTTPTPLRVDGQPGVVDYLWHSPSVRVTSAGVAFDQPEPGDPPLYLSDHVGVAACFNLSLPTGT